LKRPLPDGRIFRCPGPDSEDQPPLQSLQYRGLGISLVAVVEELPYNVTVARLKPEVLRRFPWRHDGEMSTNKNERLLIQAAYGFGLWRDANSPLGVYAIEDEEFLAKRFSSIPG
jgi:hypothetical protein